MTRPPPRSTRTDNSFPTRRSSDLDVPPRSPLDKGPARRLARGSLLKEEVEEVGQFDRRLARDFADPRVAVPDPVCTLRAGARQYCPPDEAGMSEPQFLDHRSSDRETEHVHMLISERRYERCSVVRHSQIGRASCRERGRPTV